MTLRKGQHPVAKGAAAQSRGYVSQTDVPSSSLERALEIANAIGENYGYRPATPLQVAKALEMAPTSSTFRMLAGASIAYGLTDGGYNAETVSITPLGLRIVKPSTDEDANAAKRLATLNPKLVRKFLERFNGAPISKDSIAQDVLVEMGAPAGRAGEVLKLILESAQASGFLQEIKGRKYVEMGGVLNAHAPSGDKGEEPQEDRVDESSAAVAPQSGNVIPITAVADGRGRKVFITHGKNRALIEPIKKLLGFGELDAMVSVQTQTVSQPVPGKIMAEMRSCGAAIIHVEDERHLMDKDGNEHIVLNDNVLIEIGAAMALYGERFSLVVKEGVTLPSNLSGLLELRYKGDTLDMGETVRLMEAINDMKKRPSPRSEK
jgi:predicted nucleotide-binding protein